MACGSLTKGKTHHSYWRQTQILKGFVNCILNFYFSMIRHEGGEGAGGRICNDIVSRTRGRQSWEPNFHYNFLEILRQDTRSAGQYNSTDLEVYIYYHTRFESRSVNSDPAKMFLKIKSPFSNFLLFKVFHTALFLREIVVSIRQ